MRTWRTPPTSAAWSARALGFRLGSALSFYVAADDYIYGSRFDAAAEGDETKTQNDVQLAVGFGFPVGR